MEHKNLNDFLENLKMPYWSNFFSAMYKAAQEVVRISFFQFIENLMWT